jgi:hypothetical protein
MHVMLVVMLFITELLFVLAEWSVSSFYHISVTVQNRTNVHYELFCLESHILSFPKVLQIPPESPCIETEELFNSRDQGDKTNVRIDECLFIIYINADVKEGLKSDKSTELDQEEFFSTGGYVLKFSQETRRHLRAHEEKTRYCEFLSRYRIMYKQANEKDLDGFVIPPLQEKLQFPDSEREQACQYFGYFLMGWWQKEINSYFLKETNLKENGPLQTTSEKVRKTLIAKIMDRRKSKLDELIIKYKESRNNVCEATDRIKQGRSDIRPRMINHTQRC